MWAEGILEGRRCWATLPGEQNQQAKLMTVPLHYLQLPVFLKRLPILRNENFVREQFVARRDAFQNPILVKIETDKTPSVDLSAWRRKK